MAKERLMLFILVAVIASLASSAVFAQSENNFNDTKQLIGSGVSCNILSDKQLEGIGEYYMEQMHPEESHESTHQRMGLVEGSEAEEKFHINLAKTMYCGELSTGMMGMGAGGMMQSSNAGMNAGMMGAYYGSGNLAGILWLIILILLAVALSLLIIWLYKQIKRK